MQHRAVNRLQAASVVIAIWLIAPYWCDQAPSPTVSSSTSPTKEINGKLLFGNGTDKAFSPAPGENAAGPNTTTPPLLTTKSPDLPAKGAAEEQRHSSMAIFFVLCVVGLCVLMIHFMLQTKFQYLPESVVVVFIGALVGLIMKVISTGNSISWQEEESFKPNVFFLVLLPPIIFESGYNLHKGNFFQNIGSILIFACLGTVISALVIGGGLYLVGLANISYRLELTQSLAFGSLISAVDPVATLAIFHALDVDPVLNMLVFGESILNDAVAIVLTNTVLDLRTPQLSNSPVIEVMSYGFKRFCGMFFGSAAIGVAFALVSSLLLKHVDLKAHPSLELAMMLLFCYAPYGLAEGVHLSGIMAILFCGVVMSHYTHFNLSPVTQISMQLLLRTIAFIAETCVFAYLGLAIFSFRHNIKPGFVIWSLILTLVGRACNVFPLAFMLNRFRDHKITLKMMFIMWFSGLRGAIAYALALHLEFDAETRRVLVTTTLIIILFTILVLGGGTMPLLKFLDTSKPEQKKRRPRRIRRTTGSGRDENGVSLSKTREIGHALDSEYFSEYTEDDQRERKKAAESVNTRLPAFLKFDTQFLMPFFTRRYTKQELKDCRSQMVQLTDKWYQAVRTSPCLESEEEDEILNLTSHDHNAQQPQQQGASTVVQLSAVSNGS